MTRSEYNSNVQTMQEMFAEHRVRPIYATGTNPSFPKGELLEAVFEVYWDGKWHALGIERLPMSDKTERQWDENLEYKLRGQFADSLSHS